MLTLAGAAGASAAAATPAPHPLPPPGGPPCIACAYLVLKQTRALFSIVISEPQCNDLAATIAADITSQAAAVGAAMQGVGAPVVTCDPFQVKVCVAFRSAAEGAKLQPWVQTQAPLWLQLLTGPDTCPPYLDDHTVAALVGGDGGSPLERLPPSCLAANVTPACAREAIDFPKCKCTSKKGSTPFATIPFMYKAPGRKNTTTLMCFTTATVPPSPSNSPCARTGWLSKADVWASYYQRRNLVAVGLQPAGAPVMSFFRMSWGSKGEATLKVSPLNWSQQQAEGGRICLELEAGADLNKFCVYGGNTCWISFFDESRSCCPLFSATLIT